MPDEPDEKNLRLHEFCELVGYKTSTVRKKIFKREIDSIKVGRIILIPKREVKRLLADYRPRVGRNADDKKPPSVPIKVGLTEAERLLNEGYKPRLTTKQ